MTGSVLAKYIADRQPRENAGTADEAEVFDDFGAFGWLRGMRDRALMLELRHKDGRIQSFGYAWLDSAEFDPSEGITLHFMGRTVRIIGRNLNREVRPNVRLYAGILRHRVPWVEETSGPDLMEAPETATVIESIKMK